MDLYKEVWFSDENNGLVSQSFDFFFWIFLTPVGLTYQLRVPSFYILRALNI
jgi:hypothetical protein